MRRAGASRRRRSAVTMSPCSRRTTSPGTSSRAGTSRVSPSRTTRASGLDIRFRASMACSARYSWTKPMMPLRMTMARMMSVSFVSPMSTVMTAATMSTTIMALLNWSSSSCQAGRCAFSTSSLGPRRFRRSAAAPTARPSSGRVPSAAATAAASSCQGRRAASRGVTGARQRSAACSSGSPMPGRGKQGQGQGRGALVAPWATGRRRVRLSQRSYASRPQAAAGPAGAFPWARQ